MGKKINFNIDDGELFFSDEVAVVHTPLKLYLDFKNTSPRVDIRYKDHQPMVLKHNVVVMDLQMAKELLKVLAENIANYESKFGVIEKTQAQIKAEEMAKNQKDAVKPNVSMPDKPSYFG